MTDRLRRPVDSGVHAAAPRSSGVSPAVPPRRTSSTTATGPPLTTSPQTRLLATPADPRLRIAAQGARPEHAGPITSTGLRHAKASTKRMGIRHRVLHVVIGGPRSVAARYQLVVWRWAEPAGVTHQQSDDRFPAAGKRVGRPVVGRVLGEARWTSRRLSWRDRATPPHGLDVAPGVGRDDWAGRHRRESGAESTKWCSRPVSGCASWPVGDGGGCRLAKLDLAAAKSRSDAGGDRKRNSVD